MMFRATGTLTTVAVLVLAAVLGAWPTTTQAQTKFFSSSSRGGGEGAKQNAQVTSLQGENDRMNACTAAGMVYAPTHASANAQGCVPNFTFTNGATVNNGLTVNSGGATISGGATVNGAATMNNGATVNNGLSVPSGNVNVTNRVTAGQLYVGSGNVGNIPTCTGDNKIQWNGTAWTCVNDALGATAATTETDPQVGSLTNGKLCRSNGVQVICDATVPTSNAYTLPPACGTSQKLRWNGSGWECATDQGLTAESDPQVGSLQSGKWCTSDGSSVNCTSAAPSGSTTTTTGGCSSNTGNPCSCGSRCGGSGTYNCSGSCVNCSYNSDDDRGDW
ncbi:MAG: hypothetical protein GC134_04255 [Proteobacteria bacterium]|nr:hypothetical protein [Pseudomonadota bacterium]